MNPGFSVQVACELSHLYRQCETVFPRRMLVIFFPPLMQCYPQKLPELSGLSLFLLVAVDVQNDRAGDCSVHSSCAT